MKLSYRIYIIILLLLLVNTVGMVGFHLAEHWSYGKSFYITVSTLGCNEITQNMVFNPTSDAVLEVGDCLIGLGDPVNLKSLERLAMKCSST